jgi:DNA-binding MarR family transcriptional regulator
MATAQRPDAPVGRVAADLYGLLVAALRSVPRDLSLAALSTLSNVERNGPRRLTDLAVAEGVAQPSMTTLVSNLERAGYVERRPDPTDGRAILVRATVRGSRLMAQRRRAGTEAMGELIEQLDDPERAALLAAADALAHLRTLDEQRRDGRRTGR